MSKKCHVYRRRLTDHFIIPTNNNNKSVSSPINYLQHDRFFKNSMIAP